MEAWELTTLPYGPSIASAEYQRILKLVLVDHAAYLINYIDDVLVYSLEESREAHMEKVKAVLITLNKYRLKITPGKMKLARAQLEYCGHVFWSRWADICATKQAEYGEEPASTEKHA